MNIRNLLAVLFGVLVLVFSGMYLREQYQSYVVAYDRGKGAYVKNSSTEVLGIATESSVYEMKCNTYSDFREKIEELVPNVIVRIETEDIKIPIKRVHTCVRFKEVLSTGYTCPNITYDINEACIKDLLEKETWNASIIRNKEKLYSSRYGVETKIRISDSVVDMDKLAADFVQAYVSKINYGEIMVKSLEVKSFTVKAPLINNTPNTDGSFAKRYIEADGSRQLIFVWQKGKYKTYKMSGAFPEYNPVGIYKILNKSPNAWSSTAGKWMPFWMAFTADVEQMSMLGFHSLVYWYPNYSKVGVKKIWEQESNIGTPRSTGCLRLRYSEAEKLYNWAKIGDWVLVHD